MTGVRNLHVSVKESGDQILFLRKVEPGAADRSYGIEVARLRLCSRMSVIDRASPDPWPNTKISSPRKPLYKSNFSNPSTTN